jgi:hypothetical protein
MGLVMLRICGWLSGWPNKTAKRLHAAASGCTLFT